MHLDVLRSDPPLSPPSAARSPHPPPAIDAGSAVADPAASLDVPASETSSLSPGAWRSALALAEAILPGSARIPRADARTVLVAEDIIRHFHPAAVAPFGAALQVLDLAAIAATGRPFHALAAVRQEQLLRSWERSKIFRGPLNVLGLLFKFAHFDATHTLGRMGAQLKVVKNVERPRHFDQIIRGAAWEGDDVIECDVVVVGTGAGGAVVGRELAEQGHAVVFVEEGEHYTRDAFNGSMMRAHGVFYRNALVFGNAPMPAFMGKMLGGSTAVNGATSLRTPPWVLDRWCETLDTDELSPAAMKPIFERVEGILDVRTPDPRFIGPIADVFRRGCDALGWSHGPIPRNAVGCEGSGFCDFGCAAGAKRSVEVSYLPGALNRGAIALTGLTADSVIVERGRAVGIEAVATNGRRLRIRGRAVVLAGGAIPTPAFLLKLGLANRSDQVGRNLTLHPSGAMLGHFEERIEPSKYIPQAYLCDEFLRQGVLLSAAQPHINIGPIIYPYVGQRLMQSIDEQPHMAAVAVVLRDATANGRVRRDIGGKPVVTYNLQPSDVERFHFGMVRAGEMLFAAGAERLMPALVGAPWLGTPSDLDRFRKRLPEVDTIALTSYHPLGTCKMGRDPKTSVVGLDHQTHDIPGLYVVDGSTVPSALGVNPQITIMAMATRAAAKIHEAL